MTTTTTGKMITREDYVERLRKLHDENAESLLQDEMVVKAVTELVDKMKNSAGSKQDPMGMIDITSKTMNDSFSVKESGHFMFDVEEYGELLHEVGPRDFLKMELTKLHFNKARTIAINLIRETQDKFQEMISEVETTEDAFRFMVELEEEKLKYINLFHEEAGYHFDKADEYAKFNWASIVLGHYEASRKFHQPKISKLKGISGYVDSENDEVMYRLYFNMPHKVICVKNTIKK